MPRPRHEKQHGGSKDGSGADSDSPVDLAHSLHSRRTRKRPARPARSASAEQTGAPIASPSQSQSQVEDASAEPTGLDPTQRHDQAHQHRNAELRTANGATLPQLSAALSSFETPNQARDRMALVQSGSSNSAIEARSTLSLRSLRSTRTQGDHGSTSNESTQHTGWRTPDSMARSSSSQSFSSRYMEDTASQSSMDSTGLQMRHASSQQTAPFSAALQPLTILTQNSQPLTPSPCDMTAPILRTNSNMSPPRPTRSLPRRRASARTQNRPLLSSNNSASQPSNGFRSRSSSNSNALTPSSNSTANILASGPHSRQTSLTGCLPLGGGFDPNYNPPSGMSTPRTPLAEIPLWLADMRSESRRSSTSSSTFLDRQDLLNSARSTESRHARTVSTSSSSGPISPGLTRNGSTSPGVPFRRSLRGNRPRRSDENARISPSPSYFGDYDALHSPSTSFQGQWTPFDEPMDPDVTLSSSMTQLGTTSPSTPGASLQPTASPAMSTRSRTLNRAGSVRSRRLTNPLNTTILVDSLGLPYEAMRMQPHELQSPFHQARSTAQERRTRHSGAQRPGNLLERRAATAASADVAPTASLASTRTSSRPSSRTSSPARGTRAARLRSTALDVAVGLALENTALGPRPGSLAPLQIPTGRLAPETESTVPGGTAFTSAITHQGRQGLPTASSVYVPHSASQEPISPSAFSEMTTLTQGSSASESLNSFGGMPTTPSAVSMQLDPFAQAATRPDADAPPQTRRGRVTGGEDFVDADGDINLGADDDNSETHRVLRQTLQQQKHPHISLDPEADEGGLGIQLRPRA